MSFYKLNISNRIIELLPPDKRYINNVTLFTAIWSPLQWCFDLFFKSYYEGTNAAYVSGTYNYLDQVSYLGKVYSSNIDNNTDLPTTSNWTLVQDDFIGLRERSYYTNQKVMFEYALNREFNGNFYFPNITEVIPTAGHAHNDIYITNNNPSINAFLVAKTEPYCSTVGKTTSSSFVKVTEGSIDVTNITVNIPTVIHALYSEDILKTFIEKYVPFGLTYTINYYVL